MFTWADDNSNAYSAARKNFLRAEDAFSRGHMANYRRYKKRLLDYPLLPYLEYKEIIKALQKKPRKKTKTLIKDFFNSYPDSPLISRINQAWFEHALRFDRIETAQRLFTGNHEPKQTCAYLRLVAKKRSLDENHFALVDTLWLHPKSLPRICDPILKRWTEAGHRTPEKIWQRLVLASEQREKHLVDYLTRLLPENERPLAKTWYAVSQQPALITRHWPKLVGDVSKSHHGLDLLKVGLLNLAKIAPEKASIVWRDIEAAVVLKPNPSFQLESQFEVNVVNTIANYFAAYQHPDTLSWIESLPMEQVNAETRRWQIVHYLARKAWGKALFHIAHLPDAETRQWQYWQARVLIELGSFSGAADILNELAKTRGYYGFLAANLLGRSGNLDHMPLFIPNFLLNRFEKIPAVARAKELLLLKRVVDARREWRTLKTLLPSEELFLAAGVLADRWGWHDRAIVALAKADYFDDLDIRFPMPHLKTINGFSNRFQVPTSLALAVARQESIFMTDSLSGSGALGLMQVLPSTAKEIARRFKMPYPGNFRLLEPENNIQFGTAYLNRLLKFKEDNVVLTAAAYNAGPFRVKRWRQHLAHVPEDLFIEMLPYKETRQYVKNVLAYQYIYSHKLEADDNPFGFIVQDLNALRIDKNLSQVIPAATEF